MKTFNKTFLPDLIQVNGKTYRLGNRTPQSVKVNVLQTSLKGKFDLHGKPYKPREYYFNPVQYSDLFNQLN